MVVAADNSQVSIVVVNKNDRGVADTLVVLNHHVSAVSFEVVVVDASGGQLADIAQEHPEVTWIDFPPAVARRTIAEQRNVGLATAKAQIIVYLDAHCIPFDGWLDALVAPILDGVAPIVMGAVEAEGGINLSDWARSIQAPLAHLDEFAGLNVAIDRFVFDAVGNFAGPGVFAEDVDLAWRAVDAGFTIVFAPDARIAHDMGGTFEELRRSYRYGRGRAMLYQRHRHRRRNLLGRDLHVVVYPVLLLLLPVMVLFPFSALVLLVPLYRSRRQRPLLTLLHHFVYGLGTLRQMVAGALCR